MGTHARNMTLAASKAVDQKTFESKIPAVSQFLKSISHEGRLQILCHLSAGEKSVGELEVLLGARQAAVSQQLSRLKIAGLVQSRRSGKAILYRLKGRECSEILGALQLVFCDDGSDAERSTRAT